MFSKEFEDLLSRNSAGDIGCMCVTCHPFSSGLPRKEFEDLLSHNSAGDIGCMCVTCPPFSSGLPRKEFEDLLSRNSAGDSRGSSKPLSGILRAK